MSIRIWIRSVFTIALHLMVVMILANLGPTTGYPNYSYPWKWNHYHKPQQNWDQQYEQKDQKKTRPMVLAHNNDDPEALFKKLDDMETRSEKERMADKILNPDFEKSSCQMNALRVEPKLSPAQLYRENFSHYGSDSEHGEMELDDPFASIAHNSFNARPMDALKAFDSTDQEVQRILEYSRDTNVETKPSMDKASLLAKVVSCKGDQPIKRQPLINLLCTQMSTIPTRPTTMKRLLPAKRPPQKLLGYPSRPSACQTPRHLRPVVHQRRLHPRHRRSPFPRPNVETVAIGPKN